MLPFIQTLLLSIVAATSLQDDLREKALPVELRPGSSALDYHQIAVRESKEPLIDARLFRIAGEQYYARADGGNAPYYRQVCIHDNGKLLMRAKIAYKLLKVNRLLQNYGVELYLFDTYRPIECQRALWKYFLEKAHGNRQIAGRFCSDPSKFEVSDPHTWPVHTTGGAVDLTLRRVKTGELLFMGTVFDEASPASYTDAFETKTDEDSASVEEARRNRRLLYWAMHSEGFTNYPYEWWHYDYGTQMWVQNSNQLSEKPKEAIYGWAGKLSRIHPTSYTTRLPER